MTSNKPKLEFEIQPILENEVVSIRPLKEDDFETVFQMASDPLIWEQHPSRDRYKREEFAKYFQGGIESKGAFLVLDSKTKQPIGCTRYYDLNKEPDSVAIGFTFLIRKVWGGRHNSALKSLMINHAFKFVNRIIFHVGPENFRSQKAVEKLGAMNIGIQDATYPGAAPNQRIVVYELNKEQWRD